jgi:hypothetical protein
MNSELQIQQALFGYDAGHHLLSASVQLTSDVRHFLAVATDLSGSAPPEGFDSTYTGLPVPGTPYYALFCTWLAPEITRPGCVWSHVLLLESTDFSSLSDLGALRRVFRRPQSSDFREFREYGVPLRFRPPTEDSGLPNKTRPAAERILAAIYMAPAASVVVTVDNSAVTEDLVFAVWSQQWSQLRRSFRFSTGSFADRGRGGAAFDLQVSPAANRRAWQRGGEYLVLESLGPIQDLSPEQQYVVRIAVDDLLIPNASPFRSFLFRFGNDVIDLRSAFKRLAEAYERVVGEYGWRTILVDVGEIFPTPSEAHALKEWLVNSSDTFRTDHGHDLSTVEFLLTTEGSRAYEGVSVDIAQLARSVWQSDKREVLSLILQLVRHQEKPLATAFTAAVANAVVPSELTLIAQERSELVPLLLGHRPELAYNIETWKLPTHIQWRIYEVLTGLSLESKDWAKILAAMILSETSVAVHDVVNRAGIYAIEGALRWINSSIVQESLPPDIWRDALAAPASDRVRSGEFSSPAALAFCSWLLLPEDARQFLSADRADVRLAADSIDDLPKSLRLHTAFLMVTLGLRAGNPAGAKLVAHGFFSVHHALASGNYSWQSWALLSPELPHLGMWKEWDRCEKLRRAVRNHSQARIIVKELFDAASGSQQVALARQLSHGIAR